jgi:hypothetical protein
MMGVWHFGFGVSCRVLVFWLAAVGWHSGANASKASNTEHKTQNPGFLKML